MRQRPLGSTGMSVSEVGLGTWGMSGDSYGPADDAESIRVIARAVELGITLFDTADCYGRGRVERVLGEALRGKREDKVLAVRIGNDFYRSAVRKNFSGPYLQWAVERSLKRLQTDRIDLMLLHNPSAESMRRGDCFTAARDLKAAGKLRAWGASVMAPTDARLAVDSGAEVVELPYNLLHGRPMNTVISELPEPRPGLIAHSPLEYGILSGTILSTTRFGERDHRRRRYTRDELRSRVHLVSRLRFLVQGEVTSMAQAALRFCLANHGVSAVVVGTRNLTHLEEAAGASVPPPTLSESALRRVGEIIGGIPE